MSIACLLNKEAGFLKLSMSLIEQLVM